MSSWRKDGYPLLLPDMRQACYHPATTSPPPLSFQGAWKYGWLDTGYSIIWKDKSALCFHQAWTWEVKGADAIYMPLWAANSLGKAIKSYKIIVMITTSVSFVLKLTAVIRLSGYTKKQSPSAGPCRAIDRDSSKFHVKGLCLTPLHWGWVWDLPLAPFFGCWTGTCFSYLG